MLRLSPTTLTSDEQRLILDMTAGNVRDHVIISLALGTGLRLAEILGLNVGDVFTPDEAPGTHARPQGDREGRPGGGCVPSRPADRRSCVGSGGGT
jgi:integrase